MVEAWMRFIQDQEIRNISLYAVSKKQHEVMNSVPGLFHFTTSKKNQMQSHNQEVKWKQANTN